MKRTVAVLLISSIACLMATPNAQAATEKPKLVLQPLTVTVTPPAWPKETSRPYPDINMPGAICLDKDLADVIHTQLVWVTHFQSIATEVVASQAERDTSVANAALDAQAQESAREIAEVKASRPTWLKVIVLMGGAALVGWAVAKVENKVIK